MRLLVFSPYYPPHIGGLESHSDEFNKYLSQAGAKITVFTPQLPTDAPAHETRHNDVTILRFPAWEPMSNYPLPCFWQKKFWSLWREISAGQYDFVLSRTRFFFTSLMAGHFAHKQKLPWIHVEHGSDYAQFSTQFKYILGKWYDHLIGAWVLRHSTKNIANSKASAHFVTTLSGRTDTEVIYRGIEHGVLNQVVVNTQYREQFPEKMIIGFIGRLMEGKGVKDLVTALTQLKAQNWICLILGTGSEQAKLTQQIKNAGLTEKVFLVGNKPFPEAMSLLKSFDIFVNPSYTEGIPTSVIEAAFAQKAIIATDVGGTQEIITGQGDGFLLPPRNSALLAEKLELLLGDPNLRRRMSTGAFQNMEQKFHWPETAQKYLTLFRQILS